MARLKNRQSQIPNGLTYIQAGTGWRPSAFSSFDTIVNGLVAHRQANPTLLAQGWSVDHAAVEDEVDAFNAAICEKMGWGGYITGGPSPPISAPRPNKTFLRSVLNVAVGAETLVEWIESGDDAVAPDLSERRAETCVSCPQNKSGDLLSFFTRPASEAIRKELNRRRDWNLSTKSDERLNVCDACGCPLKLKVHVPIATIKEHMPKESLAALDGRCWILSESK